MPSTVLLVDDDVFHRAGLRDFLAQSGVAVLESGNARDAFDLARKNALTAAIIDIRIPLQPDAPIDLEGGFALTRQLKQHRPEIGVVLLSAYDGYAPALESLLTDEIQGVAYKVKGGPPGEVLDALHQATRGAIVIDAGGVNPSRLRQTMLRGASAEERALLLNASDRIATLAAREREIAEAITRSQSVAGIAARLNLAEGSVNNALHRVYQKLQLSAAPASMKRDVLLAKAFLLHQMSKQP
jgi:DNA-binding NarL/FixJ family response regulator